MNTYINLLIELYRGRIQTLCSGGGGIDILEKITRLFQGLLRFTCESVYRYPNAMISWENTKSVYEYVHKSSRKIISWENTNIM